MTDVSDSLRRLPELDSCEPADALALYVEISDALIEALDGPEGAVRPS